MKKRKIVTAIISCILVAVLTFCFVGCKEKPDDQTDGSGSSGVAEGIYATDITGGYATGTAMAPQTSTYVRTLDKSEIVKPVAGVMDEHETYGVKEYPTYGKVLKGYTAEERNGLMRESHALAPSPTWKSLGIYDAIDSEGYLLKNGQRVLYASNVSSDNENNSEGEGDVISGGFEEEGEDTTETGSTSVNNQYNQTYRKLYKHTAALTHFGGGLTEDEPRIVKTITAVTHTKLESTQLTGLYAPAGEVIKIEMSKTDYYAAGGIRVLIGQNYNLFQHVSMEASGDGIKGSGLNRMPDILSIFQINDKTIKVDPNSDTVTAYVGSFFGGPIYFRPISNGAVRNISVTFTGGVRYQHFILGATTKEEYEENAKSSAPYFDLEIYDSVRFTTPRYDAFKKMTYENCTNAAVLWDKIAEVSTRVAANGLSAASAPVYIIGDCYIAAGAAFANPGRNGVVCPPGWLASALNYNSFVNGGDWGTMHEYNHCWQAFGVGNSGEVTNNAVTLVSYSLYTRISQSRTASPGWNPGWNRFTDPSKSLGELLSLGANGSKRYDLSLYATLLHNIGQDSFIAAARGGKESGSTVYYNNVVNASHYDMTYYFTEVLNFGVAEKLGGEGNPSTIGNLEKASVDAVKAKNYPMFVPVASVYQVGRSILYDGEKKYITTAQPFSYGYGEFTMDFNNYNNFKGGLFKSKGLVIPDGFTASVQSVSQPANGKVEMLANNLVKYTPKSGEDGLYSGNFVVTLKITKDDGAFTVDNVDLVINLKQNAGNQLTRTTYVYDDALKVPDVNTVYNSASNSFNFGAYAETEARKNVCTQETNTQIWGSGRNYYDDVYNKDSTNYKSLPLGRTIQTLDGVLYFSKAGTYRIGLKGRGNVALYLSYDNGQTWKNAVSISKAANAGTAYYNDVYEEHTFDQAHGSILFKAVLLVKNNENDFFGIGVSAQDSEGKFPAFANASAILDAGVQRALNEEAAKTFTTEYHYKNEYKYSYVNSDKVYASMTKLISVSHDSWDNTVPITNMFDGNANTYYHSKQNVFITEAAPFELVVDFGSVKKVNSVTFNGYKNAVGNNGMVKSFKIYGSVDGENYSLITEQVDSAANAKSMTFNFDTAEIRYYKLVVTDTDNHRYFAMNSIVFSYSLSFTNGILVAPNETSVTYNGNWSAKNELCNFGFIYTAGVGDSVEYRFNGTRFAYLAYRSADYGCVDIYVDGNLIASDVDLSAAKSAGYNGGVYDRYNIKMFDGSIGYIYDGAALSSGEHVVKIVGKSGTFNVDSFAYWGE